MNKYNDKYDIHFTGIYYPFFVMIEGSNSGWNKIMNCDPKYKTKQFIEDCARDSEEGEALKQNLINNWKNVKNPIYALCRFNLMEIVTRYIFNIVLFCLIVYIEFETKFFISWLVVLCICIILFVATFWLWLEIVWVYPIIDEDDGIVIDKGRKVTTKSTTNGTTKGRTDSGSGWKE